MPQNHYKLCCYISLCFVWSPHVGSSALVRFQSGWLVWAGRHFPAGYPLFLEGTHVWFEYSYLPTWPFKDQMPTHTHAHTLVSNSTYVTLFLSYKRGFGNKEINRNVLNISRRRQFKVLLSRAWGVFVFRKDDEKNFRFSSPHLVIFFILHCFHLMQHFSY